jgi:tRNA nucleotidyltransferase (CCA-adding enzyme)
MQIVVSHNNLDFDSLAAQLAVTKLHPTARMVPSFPVFGNVREYLTLYRSHLPIVQIKYIDLEQVSKLFIVDCQHADRLDVAVRKLIDQKRPFAVFDHHDLDGNGLGPHADSDSIIESVGAATTLLVEKIMQRRIPLSPFEATLLLTGIYEDTGCLTYSGTTARDAACVTHLLKHKADLNVVNEYIRPKLNDEQIALLQEMIKAATILEIAGTRIIISSASLPNYLDGLASLTRKLMELESANAAFSVVKMRDRIHVVGRSDSPALDVRPIVRRFGGDGHAGAGSAVTRGEDMRSILEKLTEALKFDVKPEVTASQLMVSPVQTIRSDTSMEEAGKIMIRHGSDGLVVAEEIGVVGIVSRRDVDQAMHHKLGHAPVSGFMSRPVLSVGPATPLSEIQRMLVKNDIGRLPVLDDSNHLLGLVSRREVLNNLYGEPEFPAFPSLSGADKSRSEFPSSMPNNLKRVIDLQSKLAGLAPDNLWLFRTIGEIAEAENMVAYAVGGSVRDLLLGIAHFDLDFVVEGSAIKLAETLIEKHPDKFAITSLHERFQTAALTYFSDQDKQVDLSTARIEFYEYPAALPTVEPSKLEQDLFRRDFTINSLALCLNPGQFGNLIDIFAGLEDLNARLIRILHQFSFIEDPTRIVRAARFASRLGFTLEKTTAEQAKQAISMGIFDNLGGIRMKTELQLVLESQHRLAGLEILAKLGAKLRYLDEELEYGATERKLIRRAEQLLVRFSVSEPWLVYLGLLLARLKPERLQNVLTRLHLTTDGKSIVTKGLALMDELSARGKHPKRSEIYGLLHGVPDAALAIAACQARPGSIVRRMVRIYFEELKNVTTILSGDDLIKMGMPEGPIIGQALQRLLAAKLDGLVLSVEDEREFIVKQSFDLANQ